MAGLPFASAYAEPSRSLQRATGMALALLLHVLLLLAALQAVMKPAVTTRAEREMTLMLPPIAIPPSVPQAVPNVAPLGQSLFGCTLENLANLPPEQRVRCGGSGITPPDADAVTEPLSHVKNPALRAAEMERKNTPAKIPCASITSQQVTGTSRQVFTLSCVITIPLN